MVAPAGTLAIAVICVAESIVNVAVVPLNFTEVTPVKAVPVMTTLVPTGPLAGVNDVIGRRRSDHETRRAGGGSETRLHCDRAGRCAGRHVVVIDVSETTVKDAVVPLNLTAVAPVKLEPVRVTAVPAKPLAGANDAMEGGPRTVKLDALTIEPIVLVTVILPVVAPVGTVAVICVSEFTTNVVAAVLLNLTALAPQKPVPVIVVVDPTAPLAGANVVIVGAIAGATVKLAALTPLPSASTTVMNPVLPPPGTSALIWCRYRSGWSSELRRSH